ncbi:hypothetical protein CVT24_009788 [Panaeolus cyanescens]|uniref:Uncharacterized protein n=1 Tax=Panaeolus cyanescens TaxID=181874 RepID=A0A409VAE8_9AGAR|nr:hypothetical protein CVT24_009788 [Panaeolus cyanescens]
MMANLRHPGLEFRHALADPITVTPSAYNPEHVSIDVLEIFNGRVNWKPKLNHAALANQVQARSQSKSPQLRIMFANNWGYPEDSPPEDVNKELTGNLTINFLHPWATVRRDEKGSVVSLDGFYNILHPDEDTSIGMTWFSQTFSSETSTYIIHNCPEMAKDLLLEFSKGTQTAKLLEPFATDVFIADESFRLWNMQIFGPLENLDKYADKPISSLTSRESQEAVEELHSMIEHLHDMTSSFKDLKSRLEHLMRFHQQYIKLFNPPEQLYEPTTESLTFILTQADNVLRGISSASERLKIRINLFIGFSTQQHTSTNMDIAEFTSKIAMAGQKSSSAMITIAALAMLFLPGTFVSAIFSMVLFKTGSDEDGNHVVSAGSQWWLFPAITIPLTVVIFLVWLLWKKLARSRGDSDLEAAGKINIVAQYEEKEPPLNLIRRMQRGVEKVAVRKLYS